MTLFKIDENNLELIKEQPFEYEKEIQKLTEENLNLIFNLSFVKSEFALNNFRIDSLAFDFSTNSFVIIEYKRDKNFSVIDQGYAYLSLMLNNKADFILEFNENFNNTLKRKGINWSKSKVLFVSPAFTNYQKEAINFKDLPIELWEVKKFENNTIIYNHVEKLGAKESIKTISKISDITPISKTNPIDNYIPKKLGIYTEQDHLKNIDDNIIDLYKKVKTAILNLSDFEIIYRKYHITFILFEKHIVDIIIGQKKLTLSINLKYGELVDVKNITKDVSKVGHWGIGDYHLPIDSDEFLDENLDYILDSIKQSITKHTT